MSQKYVIACDLGTSRLKVAAVSPDGAVLSTAVESYPLYAPAPDWAEQNPEEYWQAACRGFRAVRGDTLAAEDCLGLAFGGQWRVVIPVDAEGNVLCNGTIWCDKRAGAEAEDLNKAMGGKYFAANGYWPRLYWLRRNRPDIYEKARWIMEANCYLKWRATGVAVSDVTNSFIFSADPTRQAFFMDFLRHADISPDKFPPMCASTDRVGGLTAEAAKQLGLPEGTPVFGGCCDIPAAAIGTGCSAAGSSHCSLGTSGWLTCIGPRLSNSFAMPPLDAQRDVIFLGSLGLKIGPTTQWILDTFYGEEKAALGNGVWDVLNRELAAVPPGAGRLLATPWVFGAINVRVPPTARGVFVNLTSQHTRAHMAMAIFESVCYMMRENLEQAADSAPVPVDTISSITVCGGGASNPRWMQAMADILRREIRVPADERSRGAVGVAFCALVGLGLLDSLEAGKERIAIKAIYRPRPETFPEYDLLFAQYKKLTASLGDIFTALNG